MTKKEKAVMLATIQAANEHINQLRAALEARG